jgi:hypothetical protein
MNAAVLRVIENVRQGTTSRPRLRRALRREPGDPQIVLVISQAHLRQRLIVDHKSPQTWASRSRKGS